MKFNPLQSYRIQFHKGFTFSDLQKALPYLEHLGVKTIYASPIFQAVPGSMHGYDIINPHAINSEIGTLEEFIELRKKLTTLGMSWIQDIVPNHMAYHQENLWLMDVLKKGQDSKYADFFDIEWDSRLMVPFLGKPLEEVVADGELQLSKDGTQYYLSYYDNKFPVNEESTDILEDNSIDEINKSPKKLLYLNSQQNYRLCHWKETNTKINFRRFFTINGLISLNMQKDEVFTEYHKLIEKLISDDLIDGLRVDHVDGMNDPAGYLEKLRELVGDDTYIVVEKILEFEEELPNWSIEGTTGYDFLALTNNLFTNQGSRQKLTKFYHSLTGDNRSVDERTREKKTNILFNRLAGDLDNLVEKLYKLELFKASNHSTEEMREVIAAFLIECPVYRYYGNSLPLSEEEQVDIAQVFIQIRDEYPNLESPSKELENIILHYPIKESEPYKEKAASFYKRLMQYAGPVMAKGVEDTLMYTYSRFIGHNEVGDNPSYLGISRAEFHEILKERQKLWPLSMNCTATHDTKRGEDVRMRLNVLSDLPDQWIELVKKWFRENKSLKRGGAPDANDEYFIYQTIVGTYPMPGKKDESYAKRLEDYIRKALREAKRHTNWTAPDEEYEENTISFTHSLLKKESSFLKSFNPFFERIADHGIINSLSQVILKYTCPGMPDLYQGTEYWDLSMVDPDNRRPVNYAEREGALTRIGSINSLYEKRYNAHIKLSLTHHLLKLRKEATDLFLHGEYKQLEIEGALKSHVLGFTREYGDKAFMIVVSLNLAAQNPGDPLSIDWKDTKITNVGGNWNDVLNDSSHSSSYDIKVKDLFKTLPFSILKKSGT